MPDLRSELEALLTELESAPCDPTMVPGCGPDNRETEYEYKNGAVAGLGYGMQHVMDAVRELLKRHAPPIIGGRGPDYTESLRLVEWGADPSDGLVIGGPHTPPFSMHVYVGGKLLKPAPGCACEACELLRTVPEGKPPNTGTVTEDQPMFHAPGWKPLLVCSGDTKLGEFRDGGFIAEPLDPAQGPAVHLTTAEALQVQARNQATPKDK